MNQPIDQPPERKNHPVKTAFKITALTLIILVIIEVLFRFFVAAGPWEGPAILKFTPIGNPAQIEAVYDKFEGKGLLGIVEDRYLFWKLAPNSTTSVHSSVDVSNFLFAEHTFTTNSFGFRSPEVFHEKPPGTYRVVCLGDSGTFGSGVPGGAPYPARLEEILRENHPDGRFEVINAGLPGYSSLQGRILLERVVIKLNPDLITLCFGANDAARVIESDIQSYERRMSWVAGASYWMLRFKSFKWLRYHLMAPKRVGGVKIGGAANVPRVSGKEFAHNYRQMVTMGRAKNVEIMFIERNLRLPVPDTREKLIATELSVVNIPVYPTLKRAVEGMMAGEMYREETAHYRSIYGDELDDRPALHVLINPGHANELGYRIIAEEIYGRLKDMPGFKAYVSGE